MVEKTGDLGELETLKLVLKRTFSKIKEDIGKNSDEIQALNKTADNLARTTDNLTATTSNLTLTTNTITKELGEIKLLLSSLNSSVAAIKDSQAAQRSSSSVTAAQSIGSGLKTEMMRRLKRNKRSVIKQKIINVIASGQFTLPELKDIIVDENNYCSKASFYRYFEELKNRGIIDVVEINDLKIVMSKSQTSIRL